MPYILLLPLFLLFCFERGNSGQEEEATEEKASHFVGFWRDFPARDIRSPSSVVGWGN